METKDENKYEIEQWEVSFLSRDVSSQKVWPQHQQQQQKHKQQQQQQQQQKKKEKKLAFSYFFQFLEILILNSQTDFKTRDM